MRVTIGRLHLGLELSVKTGCDNPSVAKSMFVEYVNIITTLKIPNAWVRMEKLETVDPGGDIWETVELRGTDGAGALIENDYDPYRMPVTDQDWRRHVDWVKEQGK